MLPFLAVDHDVSAMTPDTRIIYDLLQRISPKATRGLAISLGATFGALGLASMICWLNQEVQSEAVNFAVNCLIFSSQVFAGAVFGHLLSMIWL